MSSARCCVAVAADDFGDGSADVRWRCLCVVPISVFQMMMDDRQTHQYFTSKLLDIFTRTYDVMYQNNFPAPGCPRFAQILFRRPEICPVPVQQVGGRLVVQPHEVGGRPVQRHEVGGRPVLPHEVGGHPVEPHEVGSYPVNIQEVRRRKKIKKKIKSNCTTP